jgi:hypothetical protein
MGLNMGVKRKNFTVNPKARRNLHVSRGQRVEIGLLELERTLTRGRSSGPRPYHSFFFSSSFHLLYRSNALFQIIEECVE